MIRRTIIQFVSRLTYKFRISDEVSITFCELIDPTGKVREEVIERQRIAASKAVWTPYGSMAPVILKNKLDGTPIRILRKDMVKTARALVDIGLVDEKDMFYERPRKWWYQKKAK